MAFIESPRFPDKISSGSRGGPKWSTDIVVTASGWEQRNIRWQDAKHEYDAGYGIRDMADMEALKDFFMTVRGSGHSFRYKDWADFKSGPLSLAPTAGDQEIGTGDDANTVFQLVKKYDVSGLPYVRTITKPVDGTVLVAVEGVPTVPAAIDTTTGLITLTDPPAAGELVTAGFEFDVPCRFATDQLSVQMEVYDVGATQVPIVEIRL